MSSYSPNSNKYGGLGLGNNTGGMMGSHRIPSQNDNPNIGGGYQQNNFAYNTISQLHGGGMPNSQLQSDIDPYAPSIVQDLLQGSNEWKNIQDIVKLTFKAVTDVLRCQGLALRELERSMPSKASKAELNAGLSVKANVADVSRTVAEVAASIENKLTFEEAQGLIEEKVSKADLQYLLSNKVSVEELTKVIENKANQHEINLEIQSLNAKVEDIYRDLSKRLTNCALQKDFAYLQTVLETKANLDDVNESLQGKANKQSVANALHRKANRTDIDQLLEAKADATDLEKVLGLIEQKADAAQIDHLIRLLDNKAERQECIGLRQEMASKSDKTDIDMYVLAVQNQKLEQEQRQKQLERELDEFIQGMQREMEGLKTSFLQSLNKKADYSLLESMKETVIKKVDHDYFQSVVNRLKTDSQTLVSQQLTEQALSRKHREDKNEERVGKAEMNAERALDEIFFLRDQLKQLQDERKKDVEETAEFIKTIITNSKHDQQREMQQVSTDIERLRREVIEKSSVNELLEVKAKLIGLIDAKPDLKEVQQALNECQTDICQQLADFKNSVKNDLHQQENDIYKAMERKVNLLDVQEALSQKADYKEVTQQYASKSEFSELNFSIDRVLKELQAKLDTRDFDEFDEILRKKIEELQNHLLQKSNIKDVCALLDMKSNIDDVNKALSEMTEELALKVAVRDFREALADQNTINEALCAENCVGRWLWKSGELSVNTCPENFIWDEEKTMIVTVAPGLYEITFGFYSNKKPTIQLLVNGEAVLSAVNSSSIKQAIKLLSYVIHHSSGKLKGMGKHSAGNLAGLTLVDFIALPARARISLSYSGELGAEGFIGLRKL